MRRRPLRVLTWNTHLGRALRAGGLWWLVEKTRPHIVALQEVVPGSGDLPKALGPRYARFPKEQPHPRANGTYVAWRADRFEFLHGENDEISFGSRFERRRVIVVLRDRRTGRRVVVASVHPDPLGLGFVRANPRARAIHERQIAAIANRLARLAEPGDVVIAAGDVNEHLGSAIPSALAPRTVRGRFSAVGLTAAVDVLGGPTYLDDVFARLGGGVRLTGRRVIPVPYGDSDHDAVLATLSVRRLKKTTA